MATVDLDLAIVGGGPAGIATALFFAAAAPSRVDRIAVLEKAHYPREKICAGAIGARADRLLERIGVWVAAPAAHVRGLSVVTPGGALSHRDREALRPIGRVVRRAEFDHAFANEARARGVRVLEGARVSELSIEPGAARLQTSVGEVRARAVVGADGVGSFVRRALGVPRGRWLAQVVEVDTPAAFGDPARDLLHFDLTDRSLVGYAWDFPTVVGGERLVCRGMYELRPDPGLIEGAPRDEIDLGERLLARLARQGIKGPARIKRFAERGLSLHEPVARPRALLVGEAAGIDPALGEGIAQAIFYGAAAGPYLARCLDRDELSFTDWPRELRRSRVGFDLALRARTTPFLYGSTRPIAEHWVSGSRDLVIAGARYFAGQRVPWWRLAGAAISLGGSIVEERARVLRALFVGRATSRSAPSW